MPIRGTTTRLAAGAARLRQALRGDAMIAGVALEVGIWPMVSHATDLGCIPVIVADACRFRDQAAAQRAWDMIAFMGMRLTGVSAGLAQVWGVQPH